jgi:hypothetical protein
MERDAWVSSREAIAQRNPRFFASLKNLKIGDSYDRAIELLGPPDEEFTIVGKPPSAPVRGTLATYFPTKISPDAAEKDREDPFR